MGNIIEWYRYVLKFHPLKYLGIAIMTFVPLYFVYRQIFLNETFFQTLIASGIAMGLGSILFSLGWDPYA